MDFRKVMVIIAFGLTIMWWLLVSILVCVGEAGDALRVLYE